MKLSLVARAVPHGAPPLDGHVAYVDIVEDPDRFRLRCGILHDDAPRLAYLLDGAPDVERGNDSGRAAFAAPRYELVDADALPDVECAHWELSATPVGDGLLFETSMPGWLDDDGARAASEIVDFIRQTARDACANHAEDAE